MKNILLAGAAALAIVSSALAATPRTAPMQLKSEPWVIDKFTGLAVPESVERLAKLNALTAATSGNIEAGYTAWSETITRYQLARTTNGAPVTLEDKSKAFMACLAYFGGNIPDDPTMQQCLARSGYYNFR